MDKNKNLNTISLNKMDHRPKDKMEHYKTSRRKHRRKVYVPLDLVITLGTTSKTCPMKEIRVKLDFTEVRNFCPAKDTIP